jgi:hypothetical protein
MDEWELYEVKRGALESLVDRFTSEHEALEHAQALWPELCFSVSIAEDGGQYYRGLTTTTPGVVEGATFRVVRVPHGRSERPSARLLG